MNICDAKRQIKNAVKAYMAKDDYGNNLIPQHKQRPVFLVGPPGIGKTAILEQIASELGIGLLSYSMTHHTRQSALGLPMIKQFEYNGEVYDISEYTMSEIIASIYETMKSTDIKNGILFLDEINCVSETLTPIMLQFLQYKVFGKHKVPNGWIIVTAGNPPEYNNSVREFDIATWDRLKRIDVEPEFEAWKDYAYKSGVHSAVISYLELKSQNFYKIETTTNGKSFVTARGWDDLSQMIKVYEHEGIEVERQLISQYIQNEPISLDFADYYDIYSRYRKNYKISDILNGNISPKVKECAEKAKDAEKIAVTQLLLDELIPEIIDAETDDNMMTELMEILKNNMLMIEKSAAETMQSIVSDKKKMYKNGLSSKSMCEKELNILTRLIKALDEENNLVIDELNGSNVIRADFGKRVDLLDEKTNNINLHIENMFSFISTYFRNENVLIMAVRTLTTNPQIASYLAKYPSQQYTAYCKLFHIDHKKADIKKRIRRLFFD
ncbi:MAG: AAA family ATPase [Ruminococcus sp.]|nr:AAA family ATPase [Ruminococcus sp.]